MSSNHNNFVADSIPIIDVAKTGSGLNPFGWAGLLDQPGGNGHGAAAGAHEFDAGIPVLGRILPPLSNLVFAHPQPDILPALKRRGFLIYRGAFKVLEAP